MSFVSAPPYLESAKRPFIATHYQNRGCYQLGAEHTKVQIVTRYGAAIAHPSLRRTRNST